MTPKEQRKVEREKKQQQRIEADLEPERLLKAEMDKARRLVSSTQDVFIERMRGYVQVEGKEEECTYELICTFNELSLKPLKVKLPVEELGFVLYGRNLAHNEALLTSILKCGRTQLKNKRQLRTRESITEEEIEMLKDKYVSSMLPDGWFFNGFMYLNYEGVQQVEHPNLEAIIRQYVEEVNAEIGDYNREVQKEWRQDTSKYSIGAGAV